MPRYVILAEHTPDICPTANVKVRARAREGIVELLPKLAEAAGVTIETGPLHLDPGHRMIVVVEGPSVETITKLVFDTGLSQWNSVEVCPATPSSERMTQAGDFPALYE